MGRDKATLPFGGELMLQRVVRLLGAAVDPESMVVVAAAEQALPALPAGVRVARDSREYRGPLEGLATGLGALAEGADAVYATGCDVPLLAPAVVEYMFAALGDHDIAVPCEGEFHHPLAAVYRPTVLGKIEELLAAERLRPIFLFDEVSTRRVPTDELRAMDPQLATFRNLNSLPEYEAALAACGLAS